MHHNPRPRKRMTLHRYSRLSTSAVDKLDKQPAGGQPESMQHPVGEMVNGVWVAK